MLSNRWSLRVSDSTSRCPVHTWHHARLMLHGWRAHSCTWRSPLAASNSLRAAHAAPAVPRHVPSSAAGTSPVLDRGPQGSTELWGNWWTLGGWSAIPHHVELPNVRPGIKKTELFRLRLPRAWTSTSGSWDISSALFWAMFGEDTTTVHVDLRLEIDGRMQTVSIQGRQTIVEDTSFFQIDPPNIVLLELRQYTKQEGSKRQSDPVVRIPRATSYLKGLEGTVLLGYRVERPATSTTHPTLVAVFVSLPSGVTPNMVQALGRGRGSGMRLLEAGSILAAAHGSSSSISSSGSTGSASDGVGTGVAGSTGGEAASEPVKPAGGAVTCANARPLTFAALRDYGVQMPLEVFKELLDVGGGPIQPDGVMWEAGVQVVLQGVSEATLHQSGVAHVDGRLPTFDACTVRVKRMRKTGRLERVVVTGVPPGVRKSLAGYKVVKWELVWEPGQSRQLQLVGASRAQGTGGGRGAVPWLVLHMVWVGAETGASIGEGAAAGV